VLLDLFDRTIEHLETGGFVMYPLLAVSLVMFFLVVKKFVEMRDFTRGDRPILECLQSMGKPQFMAAPWQMEIIREFISKRTFDDDLDRSILEVLKLRQERFVHSSIKSIAILAGVAPLLGLLGTVTGMITTFKVITDVGTGDPTMMAGGISEALLTTQFGLMTAVPIMLLHHFLERQVDKIVNDMQEKGTAFAVALVKQNRVSEG